MIDYKQIFGEDGTPNLDCGFDAEELLELSRTFQTLGDYALAKSTAAKFRLAGAIPAALLREQECDRIYRTLPKSARW